MKKVIATILSIVVLGVALCGADYVLKDRTDHGVKQGIAMYEQPKNSVDVLMLGSSHVHYGINTAKLWEEYGISAFDFSSAEQPLWISYYYLKEFCKNQKPKVVVLDFFTPAAFQEDHKYTYTHLADSLNGFRFGLNKMKMMWVSFDGREEIWDKYFPGFAGYHDRYDALDAEDFEDLKYDYENFKGFTPYFDMTPTSVPRINEDTVLAPSDKSVEYLQKIVDFTTASGIELYLTVVPYHVNAELVTDKIQAEDLRYNWLAQYVQQLNDAGNSHVFFDYTVLHNWDIGIDFESGTDTYDSSHLNYYGATKFAHYLGAHLRYIYGADVIADHRGDPYYASWDTNAEELRTVVEANGFEWR
ncbi:hypothetical protein [Butyrivibrio sp. VCB2001]|uniref:hypothetical protein n=1 Tax=Butyrivibrio sp. VCB2001 TaxID=1280667 RepID=UPI00041E8080|nr:hypothetical protein [Butyrivibrio sp. VCB2001]